MASLRPEKQLLKSLEGHAGLPVPPDSAWGSLAQAGNFRDALPLLEGDMADVELNSTKSPEIHCLEKLWWVRGQLATDGMPLAALTTPLSEVFTEAKSLPQLQSLSCSTYYLLADQLASKKQSRLSTLLFENALEFSGGLPRSERTALRAYAASTFREELERAEAKKESAAYIQKLKSRIEELEKVDASPEPKKEPPPKSDTLSTVSLSAKTIRGSDFQDKNFRDDELPASEQHLPPKKSSQIPGFLLGAVCVLLVVLGWRFGFEKRHDNEGDGETVALNVPPGTGQAAAPPITPAPVTPTPAPAVSLTTSTAPAAFPTSTPMSTQEIGAKLKAIDANLDTLGERLKNVTFKGMEKTKTADDVAKDPEVDQAALASKEAKQLSNPQPASSGSSPDELATLDGDKKPTPTPLDPRKIPLLDPKQLDQMSTTEVGVPVNPRSVEPTSRENRDSIQPSLPDFSRAGRQPGGNGVNPNGIGGPPDPQGKTFDGAPVRSYPVDRFQEPEVYKTITETNVLSAPSLLGQTIAKLPIDTSIQVVSRVGQWLELRSLGGQRGFIYAQNAVPAAPSEKPDHSADHLD